MAEIRGSGEELTSRYPNGTPVERLAKLYVNKRAVFVDATNAMTTADEISASLGVQGSPALEPSGWIGC